MIRERILFRLFFSLLLLLSFSPFCTYEPTFQIHPKAYLQLTQQEQLICALTGQHSKATMLVRIAKLLRHLSYSLGQYKEALTKVAERLNEPGYDRTSDGYAAMFAQFFKSEPTLSLHNPAWM